MGKLTAFFPFMTHSLYAEGAFLFVHKQCKKIRWQSSSPHASSKIIQEVPHLNRTTFWNPLKRAFYGQSFQVQLIKAILFCPLTMVLSPILSDCSCNCLICNLFSCAFDANSGHFVMPGDFAKKGKPQKKKAMHVCTKIVKSFRNSS